MLCEQGKRSANEARKEVKKSGLVEFHRGKEVKGGGWLERRKGDISRQMEIGGREMYSWGKRKARQRDGVCRL